jgi:hypothetical protein
VRRRQHACAFGLGDPSASGHRAITCARAEHDLAVGDDRSMDRSGRGMRARGEEDRTGGGGCLPLPARVRERARVGRQAGTVRAGRRLSAPTDPAAVVELPASPAPGRQRNVANLFSRAPVLVVRPFLRLVSTYVMLGRSVAWPTCLWVTMGPGSRFGPSWQAQPGPNRRRSSNAWPRPAPATRVGWQLAGDRITLRAPSARIPSLFY